MITEYKKFEKKNILKFSYNSHTGTLDIENDINTVSLVKEDIEIIRKIISSEYVYFKQDWTIFEQFDNYLNISLYDINIMVYKYQYKWFLDEIGKYENKIALFSDFSDEEYDHYILITKKEREIKKFKI